MEAVVVERIVLLNQLISRSVTRAPTSVKAPTASGSELLSILLKQAAAGEGLERFGSKVDPDDEMPDDGTESSFVRISKAHSFERQTGTYFTFLVEYVDSLASTFPVVDTKKLIGRELSGEADERGATAAHVVIKLPKAGALDEGMYRCVVEVAPSLSRKNIEFLFSRQLRRVAKEQEWSFTVVMDGKKGKPIEKTYAYHPRLQLVSDGGRSLEDTLRKRMLSHMVFTKRAEKRSISNPTDIQHKDVIADVELRVSGKQAPADPAERLGWIESVKKTFSDQGYETKLYYRSLGGPTFKGSIHKDVQSATDLIMCPRENILISEASRWRSTISAEIEGKMVDLLERDELWERAT